LPNITEDLKDNPVKTLEALSLAAYQVWLGQPRFQALCSDAPPTSLGKRKEPGYEVVIRVVFYPLMHATRMGNFPYKFYRCLLLVMRH
jgi:hypothetical protein